MKSHQTKQSAFVQKVKKISLSSKISSLQLHSNRFPQAQEMIDLYVPQLKLPFAIQASQNVGSKVQLAPLSARNYVQVGKNVKLTNNKSISNIRKANNINKQNLWSNTLEQAEEIVPDQIQQSKSVKTLSINQNSPIFNGTENAKISRKDIQMPIGPWQAIKLFEGFLSNYEINEIKDYKLIYYLGQDSEKVEVTNDPQNNFGFDDEKGYYIPLAKDHIAYRYELVEMLGMGSFAQVIRAFDHKLKQFVALKVIRNLKRFHKQALIELQILQHLKANDLNQKAYVIHYQEFFVFRKHSIFVFELYSKNLYELIRLNGYKGLPMTLIRKFAIQMLSCLKFLREQKIIHCDLKPENILLRNPLRNSIIIIDFGSACFQNEKLYSYIQSRFYRAPEIILNYPDYDAQVDMWSFGCIIAELFAGKPLFAGESEKEQLGCIMEIKGLPPQEYILSSPKRKLFFDSNQFPKPVYNKKGQLRGISTKSLRQAIKCDDEKLLDFINKCTHYNPSIRLNPEQAMQHQWISDYVERDHASKLVDPPLTTREPSRSVLKRRLYQTDEANTVRLSRKEL